MPHPAPLTLRGKLEAAAAATAWPKPSRADQLAGLEANRTGRSAFNYRFATPCIEVRIVGDLAAPNIFRPSRRVTQSWCQIQLTITTVMHTYSLADIIMRGCHALISAPMRATLSRERTNLAR
jgi:hypothetical protein